MTATTKKQSPEVVRGRKPRRIFAKPETPINTKPQTRSRLTAGQIHRELDRLCEAAPPHDVQEVLAQLRG